MGWHGPQVLGPLPAAFQVHEQEFRQEVARACESRTSTMLREACVASNGLTCYAITPAPPATILYLYVIWCYALRGKQTFGSVYLDLLSIFTQHHELPRRHTSPFPRVPSGNEWWERQTAVSLPPAHLPSYPKSSHYILPSQSSSSLGEKRNQSTLLFLACF